VNPLAKHRTKPAPQRFLIEGTEYTMLQIAARLGCSRSTARSRLISRQAEPGVVTWAKLETDHRRAEVNIRQPSNSHPWKVERACLPSGGRK
jgi:hypothetical protein